MEKIKTAIVGLGRIGTILEEDTLREKPCTHAGAIVNNKDCLLSAGCDNNKKRRLRFTEQWKKHGLNIPVYADAEEMLDIHKPQILVIATHPDSHYHYCKLAAKMNVPVIICEKPLADNLKDARNITKLSPIILTNHERRYSLDYVYAKSILDKEKLGSIISVRAVLYMGKSRRLVDVFWHDGTHLADILMYLTSSTLIHKKSWGVKLTEKSGTAWLEGSLQKEKKLKELPVVFEIGAGRDHLVFEMEFSCEKGRLRIGNGIFEIWESVQCPYAEKFRSLENTGETFSGPTGYFANMVKDAVACVRDPRRKPVSSAIDGLKVIEYLNSVNPLR
jgi:predicted dehydrogenase